MSKSNLDDYELFYMELPAYNHTYNLDYLEEFDTELLSEEPDDLSDQPKGLSDAQVMQLAQDSLDSVTPPQSSAGQPSDQPAT